MVDHLIELLSIEEKINDGKKFWFIFIFLFFFMTTSQITTKQTKDTNAKRTKCEIYTRVMGYFRPISQFNIGKKSEHKERIHFEEKKCDKSQW